jgi:4-hydroxy-tetrahydrodipicolinate synthase
MSIRFNGIWPALITPFYEGGVDVAALRKLIHRFKAAEVAGLVVCGTTGEAGSLSSDERLAVLDAVVDCGSGLRVVVGLNGINHTRVLEELEMVQRRPIAGVLIPPPSYVRPSQQGIVKFYAEIAQATAVPVILYNIPNRTGVSIELETIREIAKHPAVAAIKDCGGSASLTMQLIADGRLDVLAGDDLQIFSTLCLGGAGAIAASSHLRPDLFVRMAKLIDAGDVMAARQIFYSLRPAVQALFAEPNPAPLKAALAALGLIHDELRAPLLPASPMLRQEVARHARTLETLDLA